MARRQRFRSLFGLEPARDVDEELAFHLEMRARELMDHGEPAERARQLADQRFGNYHGARSMCVSINERRRRRRRWRELLTELGQDVRYACRSLRRAPGFTAVAIATLALGIGANTATFSVVNGVMLESLPYDDVEQLYRVRPVGRDGRAGSTVSAPNFMSLREHARVFEAVEAYVAGAFVLLGGGEAREIRSALVSTGMFELLGLRVVHGRGFVSNENQPGRTSVTVLDHGFWRREFGGDQAVLGRVIQIGGEPHTVVGVLAPGARLPADAPDARLPTDVDVYVPLTFDASFNAAAAARRQANFLGVVARARAGIEHDAVRADLRRVSDELARAFPESNADVSFDAIQPQALMLGDVRSPLLVLLGAVGFVLLVACANVANLFLARASARQGELAVRAALGAGRPRLIRQLLTESILVGVVGGMVGLAVAVWGTHALVAAGPVDIPRLDGVGVNVRVALFALALSLATGITFGLLPALHSSSNVRLMGALREGGRGSEGSAGHRTRALLVVTEIALAVVLLTGAGLLMRSVMAMTRVDVGFDSAQALTFRTTLQGQAYRQPEDRGRRVADVERRLRAVPGVTAVGATSALPVGGGGRSLTQLFSVVGGPPPPAGVVQEIGVTSVTPEYFRSIAVHVQRGRSFTERDGINVPLVAVVNEAAVRQWFADDPLGTHVQLGGTREIVGVVADVLQRSPGEPAAPQLFVPYAQRPVDSVHVVVRTTAEPSAVAAALPTAVREVDAGLPVEDVRSLDQLITRVMTRPRFYTQVLAAFAVVALLLAATGIFGVTSYAVTQQTREIGLRMALGARAPNVLRMVVGRALRLALIGVGVGIAAAFVLGGLLQSQLFGVTRFDPLTVAVVVVVLVGSSALASLLPARRAVRIDPGTILR